MTNFYTENENRTVVSGANLARVTFNRDDFSGEFMTIEYVGGAASWVENETLYKAVVVEQSGDGDDREAVVVIREDGVEIDRRRVYFDRNFGEWQALAWAATREAPTAIEAAIKAAALCGLL